MKGNSLGGASERHLGALLPHDLSVLYVQAEAYKDIMKGGCQSFLLFLFSCFGRWETLIRYYYLTFG